MRMGICRMAAVWTLCVVMFAGCGVREFRFTAEENESENMNTSVAECDEKTEAAGVFLIADLEIDNSQTFMVESDDILRMLCIDGEIYYDTGRSSEALHCGVMDWIIDSSVSEREIPTENMQSNFGTGYGCQRWMKGQVHVNIDDTWHIFQASEAYRLTVTNGNNGEMIELERSPAFWEIIEGYQKLDVTGQGKKTDSTGYSYCLRLYDKEDNLITTITPKGKEIILDGMCYSDNGYGTINELHLVLDALFEENLPEAMATEKAAKQSKVFQEGGGKAAISEGVDALDDVYMSVTYATNKGTNLVFVNYSDKNLEFGDDYELQMLKGGEWYTVDYIIDNWAFNAIAYTMPKNEPVSVCVDWTHFHGILTAGQYRIVKGVMDFRGTGDYTTYRLAAEFEVQ